MSDARRIRPRGPVEHDLVGMPDDRFEAMVAQLIRLDYPDARKPANTSDGGADMLLPDEADGYDRAWQSKHFTKRPNWTKCRESLAAARRNYDPSHYTFVFPRDLTVAEETTFTKHFRGDDVDIKVDYWNATELQARLTSSPEGERVARNFFEDVDAHNEKLYAAIEAGGKVETVPDVMDRMTNLGEVLATKDSYFSYPGVTHEVGEPHPPPTPGAVMSVETYTETQATRVDVVPRHEDAMEEYGPAFTLHPVEGPEGERAHKLLQEALREGTEVEIDSGLEVEFTRLPPGLKDTVGQRLAGTVRMGPATRQPLPVLPPWRARLRAKGDEATETFDLDMLPVEDVPDGWDHALRGTRGGLTMTALFRRTETSGEMSWTFNYTFDRSPVREQLAALKFFRAMCQPGTLTVADRSETRREVIEFELPVGEFDEEMETLAAVLANIDTVERWADVTFPVPETITAEEAHKFAVVAHHLRQGGAEVTWKHFTFTVPEASLAPLHRRSVVRVEQAMSAELFGQEVELGFGQVDVTAYRIASLAPTPHTPGHVDVRLEPQDAAAAKRFHRIVKARTTARKPPPPPPRKKSKDKKKRKKRKGRRK
jgi:hypothetical protein